MEEKFSEIRRDEPRSCSGANGVRGGSVVVKAADAKAPSDSRAVLTFAVHRKAVDESAAAGGKET